MLAHFFGGQIVAGELHHGRLVAAAFQFAFALDMKGVGQRFGRFGGQPRGHHGLGRFLGVQQAHLKALARHAHQAGDQFVGLALRAGVQHQPAAFRVDPGGNLAAARKGLRQQCLQGVVAQVAHFFLTGLAAGGLLDLGNRFFGAAAHGVAGHGLGFDHEAGNPLPVHHFHQRAVVFAARRHPTGGTLLRGTAFGKGLGGQRGLQALGGGRPIRADAVNHEVFEHGAGL